MGLPVQPIGWDRLTRPTLSRPGRVGVVTRLAFWGAPPPVVVSLADLTGSPEHIGAPPVVILPAGSTAAAVTVTARDAVYAPNDVLVTGGTVTVEPRLYLSDTDGRLLDDLGGLVLNGSVTVQPAQDPIWSFAGECLITDDLPRKYQDWIAPTLDFVYPDPSGRGNRRDRYRLGLYKVAPYQMSEEQWGGTATLRAYDCLWTLRADINGSAYSVAAGTNYTQAVIDLLAYRGFDRVVIQSTSNTLPKKRTWKSGTPWLQMANDLLRSNGYIPLSPDATGVLRSRRFQKIGNATPTDVYTAADVLEAVGVEPDEERFVNHVVVLGNSPSGASYRATRTNNDPGSASSTVTLGFTKGAFESGADFQSQAAVDDRADYLMERGNSLQVRAKVTTKRMHQFGVTDVVGFDLVNNAGRRVLDGKWRLEEFRIELSENAQPDWVFSRLEPFTELP